MRALYSISVVFYGFSIKIAALLGNKKAKLWVSGRKNWAYKLSTQLKGIDNCIWFHAASLGEFEQARPLIEGIKKKLPQQFILLSFFSPSGYEVQKNYLHANYVCYLPLDTKKNAKQFLKIVSPSLSVFVKYEFWFNFLNELKNRNHKTILVSGIFRVKQHFFKPYGRWFRTQLKSFSRFYLQNSKSEELLNKIGFANTAVAGDNRFDRVLELSKHSFEDNRFESFCGTSKVIVFGSSWKKENEIAVELSRSEANAKTIIAPHEIDSEKIKQLKSQFEVNTILLSETQENQDLSEFEVLIIDKIGLLSKLYRYSSVTIIGGGFGSGIHNILEAAVYGSPVIFGPNYEKFQEAKDLIKNGGGFSFVNENDLLQHTNYLLTNPLKLEESSKKAKSYVQAKSGATKLILRDIGFK